MDACGLVHISVRTWSQHWKSLSVFFFLVWNRWETHKTTVFLLHVDLWILSPLLQLLVCLPCQGACGVWLGAISVQLRLKWMWLIESGGLLNDLLSRFRSAITFNLPQYWGKSEVVIVWLDRKPPATCFFSLFFKIKVIDVDLKNQVRCDTTFLFKTFYFLMWAHKNATICSCGWKPSARQKPSGCHLSSFRHTTLFPHILPSERLCPLPPDIIGVTFKETNLLNYLWKLVSRSWVTGRGN